MEGLKNVQSGTAEPSIVPKYILKNNDTERERGGNLDPKGFHPVKRKRIGTFLSFQLRNGDTVSFYDRFCVLCIYYKDPKGCRNHIIKNFVDEEPEFRMNISSLSRYRNCTINPNLKISIPTWKKDWWRRDPKVALPKEAKALWRQLKNYVGNKTPEGYYNVYGYIENKDLFRKCMKYGLIINDGGRWLIVKPEGADAIEKEIETEKTKGKSKSNRKNKKVPEKKPKKKRKGNKKFTL